MFRKSIADGNIFGMHLQKKIQTYITIAKDFHINNMDSKTKTANVSHTETSEK